MSRESSCANLHGHSHLWIEISELRRDCLMTAIEDSDHSEKLGSGDLGYSGIISSAVDSAYVPKTMEDRKLHTAIQSRRNIVLLSLSGEFQVRVRLTIAR